MAFRQGALALAAAAIAPLPIPEGPDASHLPSFVGAPFTAQPVASPDPPRHPFMAPNGRSNLHVDAYQTDVHQGPGPLGNKPGRVSTAQFGDCGSVTFDAKGRIVTVCVGVQGPRVVMFDGTTLESLATM